MRTIAMIGLLVLTAGCARMPPLNFNYYPAKGGSAVTLVQTYDCAKDKRRLVVVTTPPVVATQYEADQSKGPWRVDVSGTRGDFTDTDFTITYYEDGRLKGINAVSTGQGEAILKSAVSLIGSVFPLVGGAAASPQDPTLPECEVIENVGKGKPVTLTFSSPVDFGLAFNGKPQVLGVSPDGRSLFAELGKQNRVTAPQAVLTRGPEPIVPAIAPEGAKTGDTVPLKLQKVYPSALAVRLGDGSEIWKGTVLVPTRDAYELPVPKASLFGKTSMVIAVEGSGAVTSIKYTREQGVAGALNVLNAAATQATPDSSTAKAAEVKGQVDLIVQSQRLARCQAQPDQCQ